MKGVVPLRNRRDDIPLLAMYFVQKLSKKTGRNVTMIGKYVLEQFMSYDWPGNIRELEHVIERSILLSDSDILTQVHLSSRKQQGSTRRAENGHYWYK